MAESFDPYYKWLGIRAKERPPNHYRLLGLDLFEDDPEVIADTAERQMAHVRTYQLGPHSALSQQVLNELAAAKVCLLDPRKKAQYDQELRKHTILKESGNTPKLNLNDLVAEATTDKTTADTSGFRLKHEIRKARRHLLILGCVLTVAAGVVAGVVAFMVTNLTLNATGKQASKNADLSEPLAQAEAARARAERAAGEAQASLVKLQEIVKSADPLVSGGGDTAPRISSPLSQSPIVPPKEVTNSIGMKLASIPAGEFMMGAPDSEEGARDPEKPQHRVRITRPFYMGVYEVTQAEWQQVMETNPSWCSAAGGGKDNVAGMDTGHFPVEQVSWNDAVLFCHRLSSWPAEQSAGRRYRLPTEAEWEYACRAGTATPFSFGSSATSTLANFNGNFPYGGTLNGPLLGRPTTVGSYAPNAFGLFDMHGNMWEWCSDYYDANYYHERVDVDPQGQSVGNEKDLRVLRGGSWDNHATDTRSALRNPIPPLSRSAFVGFRVVCRVEDLGNFERESRSQLDLSKIEFDVSNVQVMDGFVRLDKQTEIRTKESFAGPIDLLVEARTERNNPRLDAFNGACVIFNWTVSPNTLRVNRPDGKGGFESGSLVTASFQPLTPNRWHTLRWRITKIGMEVYVDGRVVFMENQAYDLSAKRPVFIRSADSVVDVRAFTVTVIQDEAAAPIAK